MKLSVIVPVYNMAAGGKLRFCLDSLLTQSLKDMEIIAVDDASTDSSRDILKEYEEKGVRVIYSGTNHRQGGARNLGMKAASGEWTGFMDSDDFADPGMFEKLLRRAEETGADVVGCDYTIVDEQAFKPGRNVTVNTDDQCGILDEEKHKRLILRPGSMVVKIYKSSLIRENGLSFPEDMFYEDNCAAAVWSAYYGHFERVAEPLYYYYTDRSSTTHHVSWGKCLDRVRSGEEMIRSFKERGLYEAYRTELVRRFAELSYAGTLFSYMYAGEKQKLKNTAYLRKLMLEYCPGFLEDPFAEECFDAEQRKLLKLHKSSNLLFFVYYKILFGYRRLRKK